MSRRGARARIAAASIALAALHLQATASGRRVDVGGFRLYVRCVGHGTPTVVLDAGAGDTSNTWSAVVPRLKKVARVCAYDRAGLGKSDPGPVPRTSGRIADELWTLLARDGIPGPYVLVGHSFGGMNVRVFAARHPRSVVGLVLVDATPLDFPAREKQLRSPAEREKLRTALGMAPRAAREEFESMEESAEDVRRAGPLPGVPIVVLTSAHPDDAPAFRKAWLSMQREMVASFPSAKQVLAATSDHYIQLDQPELVVDAIREVVSAARRKPAD